MGQAPIYGLEIGRATMTTDDRDGERCDASGRGGGGVESDLVRERRVPRAARRRHRSSTGCRDAFTRGGGRRSSPDAGQAEMGVRQTSAHLRRRTPWKSRRHARKLRRGGNFRRRMRRTLISSRGKHQTEARTVARCALDRQLSAVSVQDLLAHEEPEPDARNVVLRKGRSTKWLKDAGELRLGDADPGNPPPRSPRSCLRRARRS
jgi:hypothetical protein